MEKDYQDVYSDKVKFKDVFSNLGIEVTFEHQVLKFRSPYSGCHLLARDKELKYCFNCIRTVFTDLRSALFYVANFFKHEKRINDFADLVYMSDESTIRRLIYESRSVCYQDYII